MAHAACVVVVAWKIAAQNPFLIKKPPEKYRQDEWNETDREPRAKCKRYADEKPERARIHRMTDIRVRAGVDHFVIIRDTDVGCSETIDLEHPENKEKRPIIQSEIDGEDDGGDGKYGDKEPALPVMPRARGPCPPMRGLSAPWSP